mmetsp:Transcript_19359/g.42248  ORF Transcript_19359/g.42248 Transcript_19359/m.42248 type:complete len:318 (-) Transcript_19359:203-1156(-)
MQWHRGQLTWRVVRSTRLSIGPSLRHCARLPHASDQPIDPTVEVPTPTREQMRRHFVQSMVPMYAFGFMDNTVMIHAGNVIDLTLGVTFGLSTMAAAACGQICSDVAGVSFGGVIEAAARRLGLPSAGFTPEQQTTAAVKRVGVFGGVVGVFCGCTTGLVNLFFIDPNQKEFKLAAAGENGGEEFSVSISNDDQDGVTVIIIDGPATRGLIASVTAAICTADFELHNIFADKSSMGENKRRHLQVTKDGGQVDDSDLERLATIVMDACKSIDKARALLLANQALGKENEELRQKVERLQAKAELHRITVTKKVKPVE